MTQIYETIAIKYHFPADVRCRVRLFVLVRLAIALSSTRIFYRLAIEHGMANI